MVFADLFLQEFCHFFELVVFLLVRVGQFFQILAILAVLEGLYLDEQFLDLYLLLTDLHLEEIIFLRKEMEVRLEGDEFIVELLKLELVLADLFVLGLVVLFETTPLLEGQLKLSLQAEEFPIVIVDCLLHGVRFLGHGFDGKLIGYFSLVIVLAFL